jgi:DNA (cytosine-5)-methyltransferase 1
MVGYTIGVSNRRDEGMKFGSLFAGVGGFDLGFEAAGIKCCFQVEWDKYCQQVLAYHWPDVPRWSDVSDVKGADLPPVDVITFGSPCQDLSVAGKRVGLDGSRSNLFFEATRIIREMRDATDGVFPRVAVWENVPGSFSSNGGNDFGSVLDGLAESGALGIEWAVLDARWFGVPQRRRRVFVVAEFDPARAFRGGEPLLAVGKGSARDFEKMLQQRESITGQIVGSIATGSITGSLSVSDLSKGQTNNQSLDTGLLQVCAMPIQSTLVGRQDHNGLGKGWGDENTPMYTLTKADIHFVATSKQVRRLTEIECERLMGWPDNHTLNRADGKNTSSSQRYKMCGNGVASPVAKWVAEQILAAEPPK